jgi:hypothetical protein
VKAFACMRLLQVFCTVDLHFLPINLCHVAYTKMYFFSFFFSFETSRL